jgi:hypothetical protein
MLVVVSLARDADWVVYGGGGFAVAQTGAGGGRFEDLDSMGAQAAGALASERVLAADAAPVCGLR